MLRPLSFCPSDIFLSHLDFGLDHETLVSLGGLWMNRWVHPVFLDWGPAHLQCFLPAPPRKRLPQLC